MSECPVFLKYTVHSTDGKSRYSTLTQRTTSPVSGSVKVSVLSVLPASSFLDDRSDDRRRKSQEPIERVWQIDAGNDGGCQELKRAEKGGTGDEKRAMVDKQPANDVKHSGSSS